MTSPAHFAAEKQGVLPKRHKSLVVTRQLFHEALQELRDRADFESLRDYCASTRCYWNDVHDLWLFDLVDHNTRDKYFHNFTETIESSFSLIDSVIEGAAEENRKLSQGYRESIGHRKELLTQLKEGGILAFYAAIAAFLQLRRKAPNNFPSNSRWTLNLFS